MENNLILQDKCVLITGASSGIGAKIAQRLSKAGAYVAIHYNQNSQGAQSVLDSIHASGQRAEIFQANLTDYDSYSQLIPSVIKKMGTIHALINNAGSPQSVKPFAEVTLQEWKESIALNTEAPFFLSQAVFPIFKKQSGGHIINIGSVGVKYGGSEKTLHYSAAKAALELLTLGLAKIGAPNNILVNTVRPGVIETQYWRNKTKEEYENRVKLIPLKRAGKTDDIAEMVYFLLTPQASFITGQMFTVSGGE